jgi:hypothetical protein
MALGQLCDIKYQNSVPNPEDRLRCGKELSQGEATWQEAAQAGDRRSDLVIPPSRLPL